MKYAITENGRVASLDEVMFNNIGAINSMMVRWPAASEETIFVSIGKQTISLDRDFGHLLGLYIGDGWCDGTAAYPGMHIASIDKAIIDKYRDSVNAYLRDTSIKGHETGNNEHNYWEKYDSTHGKFSIHISAEIRDSMLDIFGHGAYNKHIPRMFMDSPSEFRWGLLSGLIDTDGSISCRDVIKKGKLQQNKNAMYATQSWQLAQDVQTLCMSLGVGASITIMHRKERHEYTVVMGSVDLYEKRRYLSCATDKKRKLDKFRFGEQTSHKDILPFDKEIKDAFGVRFTDNKSLVTVLNTGVRNGYITRSTFIKHAPERAVRIMDSKYGIKYRWESVLGIVVLPDDHTETELVSRIREVKDNVKKVA